MRQVTLDRLYDLRLLGMRQALKEQMDKGGFDELSFDERLSLLIEAEDAHRMSARIWVRIKKAKIRQNVRLEELDYRAARNIDRGLLDMLGSCRWLREKRNLILGGPTGVGKTFLSSALTLRACQEGFSARYFRAPRLLHDLDIARADGTYKNKLSALNHVDLIILDDWLIAPLHDQHRRDLLEILDDRYDTKSTMIASQLPVELWHEAIGDATMADAILDRLVHNAYRLDIKGESFRKIRGIQPETGIIDQALKDQSLATEGLS
jgi:DNA replication protein DnaC